MIGIRTLASLAIAFAGSCLSVADRADLAGMIQAEVSTQISANVDTTVAGVANKVEAKLTAGDIQIGGGGDRLTDWIREVGIWVLLAVIYYPLVHRPIRRAVFVKKAGDCVSPLTADPGDEWTAKSERGP